MSLLVQDRPASGRTAEEAAARMFVMTPAEVAAVVEAYRASGSLEAAAAALRATFRALTESQAHSMVAQIIGVPPDREDPAPAAWPRPQPSARLRPFPSRR